MDAFSWEVIGSIAGIAAVIVAIAMWLFPSPRRIVNHNQSSSGRPSDLQALVNSREGRAEQIIFGEIPRQSISFQERPEIQNELAGTPESQGSVYSLIGVRGAGKSQLAAALARKRISDGWPLVAWINSESYGPLIEQLSQLSKIAAKDFGSGEGDPSIVDLRHWLERDGSRCLLIFDNADDADALQLLLPATGKAHIIITSHRRVLSNVGAPIFVGPFTRHQALNFLVSRTGRDDKSAAKALAADLGYLPLALSQAAAVVVGQNLDYVTYRERLAGIQISSYLGHVEGDSYPIGVAEAITLSISNIGATGHECRELLELLSVLSPSGISRRLLYAAAEGDVHFTPFDGGGKPALPPITLSSITESALAMDEALQKLSDASLTTWSIDGSAVVVHRLVARVVRERADYDGSLWETSNRAIAVLAELWPKVMRRSEVDAVFSREIVSHVIALTENLPMFNQPRVETFSRVLDYLQALSATFLAGFFAGLRKRIEEELKMKRPQSRSIRELEDLAIDMERMMASRAGSMNSKTLSELTYYLARMRRIENSHHGDEQDE